MQPPLYLPTPLHLTPPTLSHHFKAILAVLLSLKKRPVIRWERMSQSGRILASEVQVRLPRYKPHTPLYTGSSRCPETDE